MHGLKPLAVALVMLPLAACHPHQPEVVVPRVVLQWQSVAVDSPLIAEAYLQSLIALTEDDPWSAARARDYAFQVAQQCGLITGQRQACAPCEAPRRELDRPVYMKCLSRRLQCLGAH